MPHVEKRLKKFSEPKMELSEEERERRRQNVVQLTKEGKMGGQYGKLGGRPRKPRAAEKVAESAREHAAEIAAAFLEALESDNHYVRLNAAKEWLKVEHEESKLQRLEERDFQDDSKEEIIAYLVSAIGSQLGDDFVIDAEVIEDEPKRIGGLSEEGEET